MYVKNQFLGVFKSYFYYWLLFLPLIFSKRNDSEFE